MFYGGGVVGDFVGEGYVAVCVVAPLSILVVCGLRPLLIVLLILLCCLQFILYVVGMEFLAASVTYAVMCIYTIRIYSVRSTRDRSVAPSLQDEL